MQVFSALYAVNDGRGHQYIAGRMEKIFAVLSPVVGSSGTA